MIRGRHHALGKGGNSLIGSLRGWRRVEAQHVAYAGKILFRGLCHGQGAHPFQAFAALLRHQHPKRMRRVGVKIVETEGKAVGLPAPHDSGNTNAHAQHVDHRVELVSREVAQGNSEVVL